MLSFRIDEVFAPATKLTFGVRRFELLVLPNILLSDSDRLSLIAIDFCPLFWWLHKCVKSLNRIQNHPIDPNSLNRPITRKKALGSPIEFDQKQRHHFMPKQILRVIDRSIWIVVILNKFSKFLFSIFCWTNNKIGQLTTSSIFPKKSLFY